jgi:K+-transporting ATPase ATPase A chain
MEGKEVRFGIVNSALFATATTATSTGAVNAMHSSLTPLGGLVPMFQMMLGEVVFGGVGAGLYSMLVFVILTVFIVGLMVGRTPEYLGKKIEAFDVKMATLAILIPSVSILIGSAVAVATRAGTATVLNPGPHGLSEILYAFSSASANNGSAFAGLNASTPFYTLILALAMLVGRFGVILPVLAIAGNQVGKRAVAPGPGTFQTGGLLFGVLLIGTILIVGALTFFPALALGPIIEHLLLWAGRSF